MGWLQVMGQQKPVLGDREKLSCLNRRLKEIPWKEGRRSRRSIKEKIKREKKSTSHAVWKTEAIQQCLHQGEVNMTEQSIFSNINSFVSSEKSSTF